MNKFVIMVDATSDVPKSFCEKYDIIVIPTHVKLPAGNEIMWQSDWDQYPRDKFYADLRKGPNGFATAPPSVAEFTDHFENIAKEGKDILFITISEGMSGTYNFSKAAADAVMKKYPDIKIHCVDSRRYSTLYGLMAVHAAMKREEGLSMQEVADYIEENKNCYHQAGWMDDLSILAKKGRISNAKAFFGQLAGIKPIGEVDESGMTSILGKARGAKAGYKVLLKYMEETIENPEEQIIFIAHTMRDAQAQEFKKMIEEKFHPKEIYINDIFPPCGVNIGTGLMGAFYWGKPLSKGLEREKEIIEGALAEG